MYCLGCLITIVVVTVSCHDTQSINTRTRSVAQFFSGSTAFASSTERPECTSERQNQLVYIIDTKKFYYCVKEQWKALDIKGEKGDTGANGSDASASLSGYSNTSDASSNTVHINKSKVGIGTTSPQAKLSVAGGGAIIATLDIAASGCSSANSATFAGSPNLSSVQTGDVLVDEAGQRFPITAVNTSASSVSFAGTCTEDGSDDAAIHRNGLVVESGNVGIRTTSPSADLQVSGGVPGNGRLLLSGRPDWTSGGQYAVGAIEGMNEGANFLSTRIKLDGNDVDGTIIFQTATGGTLAEKMRIEPNGNIGIGTTNPQARLDVNAYDAFIGYSDTANYGILRLNSFHSNDFWFQLYNNARTGTGTKMNFSGYQGTNNTMTLDIANTNVGIGITSPQEKLHVNGKIRVDTLAAAAATAVCIDGSNTLSSCSSSLRYKENVEHLNLGLSAVMDMRPVVFQWRKSKAQDLGFIAEEMHAISPLLSTYRNDQIEGVKYGQVSAVLVKAMQELKEEKDREIAQLKALIMNRCER